MGQRVSDTPLRDIRNAMGLTLLEMGRMLGYSNPSTGSAAYYSKVEGGKVRLPLEKAYHLESIAGLTIAQMVGRQPLSSTDRYQLQLVGARIKILQHRLSSDS